MNKSANKIIKSDKENTKNKYKRKKFPDGKKKLEEKTQALARKEAILLLGAVCFLHDLVVNFYSNKIIASLVFLSLLPSFYQRDQQKNTTHIGV